MCNLTQILEVRARAMVIVFDIGNKTDKYLAKPLYLC